MYIDDRKKELLEANGWEIECESPFEMYHAETGSRATGIAAEAVANELWLSCEPTVKELALQVISDLPDDASLNEIIKVLDEAKEI